jgi:voltage-gated potassium channel
LVTSGSAPRLAKRHVERRPLEDRGFAGFLLYRLRFALGTLVALFCISTAGYVVIAHYSLIDGAFMTVITVSTVGYSEVHPLDAAARLFTMAVIIASFGIFLFAASQLTSLFTSGEAAEHFRRTRGRRLRDMLEDHVIVVGFGRVGQATARGVRDFSRSCLVIERRPELEATINAAGYVAMIGDATDEQTLREAGIDRAVALIAAAEDDSTNLVVALTARAVRADLRIVSRVNELDWQDRIIRAGADVAQSPYRSYGTSLAVSAITPGVLEMHTLPLLGLATEEIEISPTSTLIGRSVADVGQRARGVLVIGLRRDQTFQRWDDVIGVISAGDVIVALGTPERVRDLAKYS